MSNDDDHKVSAVEKRKSLWGRISAGLAGIGALFILNFFLSIISNSLQGEQIIIAFKIGLTGIIFGLIDLIKYDDKTSLYAVICNLILVVFPIAYWYIGTLIESLIYVY